MVEGSEVIPQVMVTKYTLSKEPIASGDEVELTLTLTNHMEYATAYHIEVLVFAAAGELVMPSGEVNQRYVPQLGPKESVNVSLRMKATERLYTTYASVEIELSYVNQWGYVGTNYSMITPHLLPDSGIRVENLFVPPKAVQGEKTLVTLDYRNIGTRPLHNMSLIPTGKIENSGKPIVMPNLEVNYTDGLDCYLTFQETGMQEVGLRLRYTDDVGNAYEETLPPIMIEVVEQAEKEKKLLDMIKNQDVESLLNEAEQLVMQYRLPLIISGGLLGVILLLLIIRKVFWRRRL